MKPRIYLDTSVFGGYFEDEFAEFTQPHFKRLLDEEFVLLYSGLTEKEMSTAPKNVKDLVLGLPQTTIELIEANDETTDLALSYLEENVVGRTSLADCIHIATATMFRADYLVSWNFKHIVNVNKIRGYNSVNIKRGYKVLEIRSPREFMLYGNED
jgi:hypothetical protein